MSASLKIAGLKSGLMTDFLRVGNRPDTKTTYFPELHGRIMAMSGRIMALELNRNDFATN
jgi:hypothetical protein